MNHKVPTLVNSLKQYFDNKEHIATPGLSKKLARLIELYPEDKTIGGVYRVISKMSDNNKIFVTRSELKSLYNKYYTRNTKFAELCQEEIGEIQKLAEPKLGTEQVASEIDLRQDNALTNALSSVFDKNLPLKLYSDKVAQKAEKEVFTILDSWNVAPNKIGIASGNDKFLVIKADYETPKGLTSFYVPIEINGDKISKAEIFMGNKGPQTLNNTIVKQYLLSYAGQKLNVNSDGILGVLTENTSKNTPITDLDLALASFKANKNKNNEFATNQIVGQKIAEATKEVELPKSDEFLSFEKQFTSPYGQASFQFGSDKVKIARDLIVRKLAEFGFKNPQLNIAKVDTQSIFYSVAVEGGKVGFTVPVKLAGKQVAMPNVIVCNGSLHTFNKITISKLLANNITDLRATAQASSQFNLKPSDLLNNIRTSLAERNFEKAEDALNVLANMNDEKAYATGFQLFMEGLSHKEAAPTTTCSRIIKNSTSSQEICGHTNLPLNKVYQDSHGNCLPLYRKGMSETYEGATFMNSKIFG